MLIVNTVKPSSSVVKSIFIQNQVLFATSNALVFDSKSVSINGRVALLLSLSDSMILLATEKLQVSFLSFPSLSTLSSFNLSSNTSRNSNYGFIATNNSHTSVLHLHQGILNVIPFKKRKQGVDGQFDARIDLLHILDLALDSENQLYVLYQDHRENRFVALFYITDNKLVPATDKTFSVDDSASIIKVINSGFLLIASNQSITAYNFSSLKQTITNFNRSINIKCHECIDSNKLRHFFSDDRGFLTLVVFDPNRISLSIEDMGQIGTIPSTLTFYNEKFLFCGSHYGDSLILEINTTKVNDSFFNIIERIDNCGPILDFVVADFKQETQSVMYACCGGTSSSKVVAVSQGIASTTISSVQAPVPDAIFDSNGDLFFSFWDSTRRFEFNRESSLLSVASMQSVGGSDDPSILVSSFENNLVQVTSNRILYNHNTFETTCHVFHASIHKNMILLGLDKNQVILVDIQNGIQQIATEIFESEVSCVFMSTNECCIGLWNGEILILDFQLQKKCSIVLPDSVSRDLALVKFESSVYLLVSHGHGNFHSYIFNENLEFSRSLTLGTRYFKFSIFKTNDKIEKILCSTECPTIIHSKNNHLLFSVLDQKDIQLAIQFNQDYVALADSTSFKIATIDVNLKLQFKKHDIDGDTAVRISYQQGTLTFGVGCTRILEDKGKGVDVVGTREVSFFKLYEQESFKEQDVYRLEDNESVISVSSLILNDTSLETSREYYIVGTAFVVDDEDEPTKGRVLLFSTVSDISGEKRLSTPYCHDVEGSVYSSVSIRGRLIIAVNSRVQMFRLTDGVLVPICSYTGHIASLILSSRDDYVLIGDLMNSVTVLAYKPATDAYSEDLVEVSNDSSTNWMTATEFIQGTDSIIGAESNFNLFSLQKSDIIVANDVGRLHVGGVFHLGDFVNKFRKGSLVLNVSENDAIARPELLFCTVDGMIGSVSVVEDNHILLEKVQSRLQSCINPIGGFDHKIWRSFLNERKTLDSSNFIDGDLIEMFLKLSKREQDLVCADLEYEDNMGVRNACNASDLIGIVECLSRIH